MRAIGLGSGSCVQQLRAMGDERCVWVGVQAGRSDNCKLQLWRAAVLESDACARHCMEQLLHAVIVHVRTRQVRTKTRHIGFVHVIP